LIIRRATKSKQLPVFLTAKIAATNVLENLKYFGALAAIPMASTVACTLIVGFLFTDLPNASGILAAGPYGAVLIGLLDLFFCSVFVVAWFRFQITGRGENVPKPRFVVNRRTNQCITHLLVFFYLYLGTLLTIAVFLRSALRDNGAFLFVSWALPGVLVIAGLLVAVRTSLQFPEIAMGHYKGLLPGWRQMRGTTWRLSAVLLIICAPFVGVDILIYGMEINSRADAIIFVLIVTGVSYVQTALIVSTVSLAYTWLGNSQEEVRRDFD